MNKEQLISATPQSMRGAIAELVRVDADTLNDSLGGIVVTTSESVRDVLQQARKQAFDRWFSGSVIVDSEGRPLQVLHGTRKDFSAFRSMERYPSKKLYLNGVAAPKADGWDMGDDRKGVPEGIHYSAWVDALTLGPKEGLAFREAEHARYGGNDPDTLRHLADLKRLVEGQVEWRDEVHPTGDAFYFSPSATYSMAFSGGRNNNLEEGGNLMPVYLSIKNPIYLDAGAIEVAGVAHNVERYKAAGYDGAIYVPEKMFGGNQPLEMDLGSQSAQIVAFYPEQIKGVFNRGTYDPASPEILHSLVEEEVVSGTSLSTLRANAVAAKQAYERFERSLRGGQEPDFDTYIRLSEARSTAESALATALQALPEDGFALQAKTPDGRMLMLTRSAQKAGHYQLTRFDRKGVPWGDTQYPTKAQGIAIFIDEADVATVIDAEGILDAAHDEDVTRDAAFAAWFGDSKVVGPEGNPLVVYHGTATKFSVFNGGRGVAGYFTDDLHVAQAYADNADGEDDPVVMPVHLSIKNPMVIDEAWAKENLTSDYDGTRDWTLLDDIASMDGWLDKYDGIYLKGVMDFAGLDASGNRQEKPHDQWVAFRPEQIKSVLGNRGTYDPRDPDIRHSLASMESTPLAGSKAVDRDGSPLVVFHGTSAKFELGEFEVGRPSKNYSQLGGEMTVKRLGAFFSTSREMAESFAKGPDAAVLRAHLDVRNPVDLTEGFPLDVWERMGDFLREWNLADTSYQNMWELFDVGMPGATEFVERLRQLGYDGAVLSEAGPGGDFVSSWVVFDSSQIHPVPRHPRKSLTAGIQNSDRTQAWHDASTNTTVFLADRIPAGREASVFLHEIVHRHGRAALPAERFGQLVDQVKAWADYGQGSTERTIHDAAQRRVATARVTGAAADEELFAYAVEEAVARGVQPSAAAVQGSAQQWLQAVVESIQRIGEKLIGNDLQGLDGQDLVDLAYALAQVERPEYGLVIEQALEDALLHPGVACAHEARGEVSMGL